MALKDIKKKFIRKSRALGTFLDRNKKNPRLLIPAFAAVGVLIIALSQAATFSVSVEPEASTSLAGCASKISDSTASAGSAVQFGCVGPTTTLDNSGKTIPSYGYTIPTSNVIFLATNGNDTNAGTISSPVATINKAVSLVPQGGTIVVRGGEYRQGNFVINKGMTIMGYPGEQAWFNGADIVPASSWTSDGAGHWTRTWDTPSFCAVNAGSTGQYYSRPYNAQDATSANTGPCSHADNIQDPAYPAAGDPQMVFIDGVFKKEVAALANVTADTFFYDWTNKKMYIGTDPAGKTVELAARPTAFTLGGGRSSSTYNYSVIGVGFKKYATNEHESSFGTSGALVVGAYKITVEKTVFTQNAAKGLGISNPVNGSYVKNSIFAYNGFNGLGSNGGTSSGTVNNFVVEGNVFNGNNVEGYGRNCTRSCAAAAIKYGHMYGFTIKNNIMENGNTVAAGFWCDIDCRNGVMVNNIARNNTGGDGIFYEISNNGIIASNLLYNNRIGIRDASANTKTYNNTSVNNITHNIWMYDDNRDGGTAGVSGSLGPNSINLQVANNIFYGVGSPSFKVQGSQNTPAQMLGLLNFNSYYRPAGTGTKNLFNWNQSGAETFSPSVADFRAKHGTQYEPNARDISDGTNPFVDLTNNNYNIKSGSVEINSGTALPADVAAALGLPAGTVPSRGALSWPGK